ncbi:MAG: zeta toxin family protein [Microbacteriaceae bacterium]|nr:zeta toxin family protein [Microbacteriaceae bacterium]
MQPIIFDGVPEGQEQPTLLMLGAQPGAGKSRATGRLLAEYDDMAALTGDDLRIFHPRYRDLTVNQPEQAGGVLVEATRGWVRAALDEALTSRRSLLLEGTFGDPDVTLATAARFQQAGFRVRIVAIASPRVLSLVSAASRYLRDRKLGHPARFTRLSAHDRGYDGTTRLIETVGSANPVDRISIISRNGQTLFDAPHDSAEGFETATTALEEGRHPDSWGARSTMELLGELKQITGYAIASGRLSPEVAELLDAAHEQALREVVPKLSVASDSPQARFIQQAVTEQLIALRRAADDRNGPEVAADLTQDVAPAQIEIR